MNRRIKKKRSKMISGSYKNRRILNRVAKNIVKISKKSKYDFKNNENFIFISTAPLHIYEIEIIKE